MYTGTNNARDADVEPGDRPCGNVNGPAPNADLSDVVLQFLAIGDTPYDGTDNACLDSNGNEQRPCTDWNCGSPEPSNTCLYTGTEYTCMKESIIPHMKTLNTEAAFAVHVGDILKGVVGATNERCTDAALDARMNLFDGTYHFPSAVCTYVHAVHPWLTLPM